MTGTGMLRDTALPGPRRSELRPAWAVLLGQEQGRPGSDDIRGE
jgi:hypothetical protein